MASRIQHFLKLIFFFVLLGVLFDSANSCSCLQAHPQTHFCNAQYVILARIVKKSPAQSTPQNDAYKIEIRKTYKVSANASSYLRDGVIFTPKQDSFCAVNFIVNRTYVIAGQSQKIGLCNYFEEYSKLTPAEKHGFANNYQHGCDCRIEVCFSQPCRSSNQACFWSPSSKCERYLSGCLRTNLSRQWTKCHWRKTLKYKNCLRNP